MIMQKDSNDINLDVTSFTVDRLIYSCNILSYMVDNRSKFMKNYFSKNNAYSIKTIMIKSLFMDCIECLYVAIPAIYKSYFNKVGVKKLKHKVYNKETFVNIENSSWVIVLKNAEYNKLITKNARIAISDVLRIRGVIIHSYNLMDNEYYNNINLILLKLSTINLCSLRKDLVKLYSSYNNYKVDDRLKDISVNISVALSAILEEVKEDDNIREDTFLGR